MQSHGTRGNFWCFCFVARSSLLSSFLQGEKRKKKEMDRHIPERVYSAGKSGDSWPFVIGIQSRRTQFTGDNKQ
jgi:hypothetical protein